MPRQNTAQGRYWTGTIPADSWNPPTTLPQHIQWVKGQKEIGAVTGYEHWQIIFAFTDKQRISKCKQLLSDRGHYELSRSTAADDYVWKEDTAVPGTRFEIGEKAFRRNNKESWEKIWDAAKNGKLDEIPASVRVQSYRTIKQIEKDFMKPTAMERTITVYWGPTGVGKSRKAWEEAGLEAYPKDPNTKFWDGYQGQSNVVMDEFRGKIDISHLLRWFDRYPVCVEQKFGACVFRATKMWVTSNLNPREWYPDLDEETKNALMRRLNIVHCPINLF